MDIVAKVSPGTDPPEVEARIVLTESSLAMLFTEFSKTNAWKSTRTYIVQDLYLPGDQRVRRMNTGDLTEVQTVEKKRIWKTDAFGAAITVKSETPVEVSDTAPTLVDVRHVRFAEREDYETEGFMYTLSKAWGGSSTQEVRAKCAAGRPPDEYALEIEILNHADDGATGRCPRYKLHSLLLKVFQIIEMVGK
ncbi:MAG: hypothetical protein CL902_00890 [Dehalococcoidia bacterium]|nr:hypothetical protein [Dehalococcoidia bacterium]